MKKQKQQKPQAYNAQSFQHFNWETQNAVGTLEIVSKASRDLTGQEL
jgi:hypothetical protein